MKKDGTFTKLPAPKAGNKYVIKKKTISTKRKQNKSIFKRIEKKSRSKSNSIFFVFVNFWFKFLSITENLILDDPKSIKLK